VADSLKLALFAVVACALAWSGWLDGVGRPLGERAAFLLYFTWPGIAVVMSLFVAIFAARDIRGRKVWQAGVALLLSLATLAVSWTQFHGWD
jgi:hypothetical protein